MAQSKDSGRVGAGGKGSVSEIKIDSEKDSIIKECIGILNRYMWSKWKYRLAVKKRCSVTVQVGHYKNGLPKYKKMFKCEKCNATVEKIEVNHIEPRIGEDGFNNLDEWVFRTFVDDTLLNGLCKPCHTRETALQAHARAKKRRELKDAGNGTSSLPEKSRGRKRKTSAPDSGEGV